MDIPDDWKTHLDLHPSWYMFTSVYYRHAEFTQMKQG